MTKLPEGWLSVSFIMRHACLPQRRNPRLSRARGNREDFQQPMAAGLLRQLITYRLLRGGRIQWRGCPLLNKERAPGTDDKSFPASPESGSKLLMHPESPNTFHENFRVELASIVFLM